MYGGISTPPPRRPQRPNLNPGQTKDNVYSTSAPQLPIKSSFSPIVQRNESTAQQPPLPPRVRDTNTISPTPPAIRNRPKISTPPMVQTTKQSNNPPPLPARDVVTSEKNSKDAQPVRLSRAPSPPPTTARRKLVSTVSTPNFGTQSQRTTQRPVPVPASNVASTSRIAPSFNAASSNVASTSRIAPSSNASSSNVASTSHVALASNAATSQGAMKARAAVGGVIPVAQKRINPNRKSTDMRSAMMQDLSGFNDVYIPPQTASRWEEFKTEDGYTYYFDASTGESVWQKPADYNPPSSSRTPLALRQLSMPVIQQPKAELTVAGDASIGLPYNVKHKQHADSSTFEIVTLTGKMEKKGWLGLGKQASGGHKLKWCVILDGSLAWFKEQFDIEPEGCIVCAICSVERGSTNSQKHHVMRLELQDKSSYFFAADNAKDLNDWIAVLKDNGATEKASQEKASQEKASQEKASQEKTSQEQVPQEIIAQDKQKKQEAARKRQSELNMKLKEEEYIKNKYKLQEERQRQIAKFQKEMQSTDFAACLCSFIVKSGELKNGKMMFLIDVQFGIQQWSIFRHHGQFVDMLNELVVSKAGSHLGGLRSLMPSKSKKPEQMPGICQQWTQFMEKLEGLRTHIFEHKRAKYVFCKFIAPVQMGDIKPPGFMLPFNLIE